MRALLFALAVGWALLAGGAVAQSKRVVLRDHPRLQEAVSAEEKRIELGALLERFSNDKLRLEADDRITPVSGYPVTIVMKGRPLWEVLDGVVRLYSTRSDPWYWTSEGTNPTKLVLHNTARPEALKSVRQLAMENYCLAQRRQLSEFFALSRDERDRVSRDDPFLRAANNRRTETFHSFLAGISDDDLRRVMRGERRRLPVTQLSNRQRQFIREEYGLANLLDRDDVEPPESLEHLTLSGGIGGDASVALGIGQVGSHGVLGGIWLEGALQAAKRQDWLASGEDVKAERKSVPSAVRPGKDLRIGPTRDDTLFRLALLAEIDIICDDTGDGTTGSDRTLAGELGEVLASMPRLGMAWKRWRTLYLFASSNRELIPRDHYVGWPKLRALRRSAQENGGYLKPQDWLDMAALSADQLHFLRKEFADASEVAKYQSLLQLAAAASLAEREALARPTGAGWADWSDTTRARLQMMPEVNARAFKAHLRWNTTQRPPHLSVWAEDGRKLVLPTISRFFKRGEKRPPLFPPRTD